MQENSYKYVQIILEPRYNINLDCEGFRLLTQLQAAIINNSNQVFTRILMSQLNINFPHCLRMTPSCRP